MKKLLLATIMATMGLSTVAQAQDGIYGGDFMHEACRNAAKTPLPELTSFEMMFIGICMGVAMQTMQLGNKLDSANRFCAPDFMAQGQAVRLIVKGLDSPTNRVRDIRALALKMFREEWPCK